MPNHAIKGNQIRVPHLSSDSLLLAATDGAVDDASILLLFLVILVLASLVVLASGDPEAALTVLEGSVLTGKVNGLTLVAVAAALRKSAGTGGELG